MKKNILFSAFMFVGRKNGVRIFGVFICLLYIDYKYAYQVRILYLGNVFPIKINAIVSGIFLWPYSL